MVELASSEKRIQRLGDLDNLRTIHNINIIFWGMGNFLGVNVVDEPGVGHDNGSVAKPLQLSIHLGSCQIDRMLYGGA